MEALNNEKKFFPPASGKGDKDPGRKKALSGPARKVFNVIFMALALVVVISFVYQGIIGMKGENAPRLRDLKDVPRPEFQPDDYGVVAEVYDGDTVLLEDGRKIRYLGIDTPETAKPWDPVSAPYADEAKEYNWKRVMGREVGLIYGPERKDHYGRTLAYVIVDGNCVNSELARRGLARLFIAGRYMKFKDWFLRAEAEAKEKRLGIWRNFGLD